jgi:hypothetical protein
MERLEGIRTTLASAGVKVASGRLLLRWEPQDGLEATTALLQNARPRALICLNDRLALGAYQALADHGLTMPTDVSVVSFDDDAIASWARPGSRRSRSLTTTSGEQPSMCCSTRSIAAIKDAPPGDGAPGRDAGSHARVGRGPQRVIRWHVAPYRESLGSPAALGGRRGRVASSAWAQLARVRPSTSAASGGTSRSMSCSIASIA